MNAFKCPEVSKPMKSDTGFATSLNSNIPLYQKLRSANVH